MQNKIIQISASSVHPGFGYGDALTNAVFGLGNDNKVYVWDFKIANWVLAKLTTNEDKRIDDLPF